jgi:hypothetical protein
LVAGNSEDETKPEKDPGKLIRKDNSLVYEENTEIEEEKPVQETTCEIRERVHRRGGFGHAEACHAVPQ